MGKEQSNAVKPFWSWNDKLDPDKLCRQIDAMKQNGIEGFFMHARGGLQTEYMSEEWFNDIKACLDKSDELGMQAWAYDENGWPSGFADGKVPAMGENYQQKWLICEKWNSALDKKRILGCYRFSDDCIEYTDSPDKDCIAISYDVNPYYIDTFNAETIQAFIKLTHEKYYEHFGERFGSSLKGFFTDEPQYGNNGFVPWSQVFPESFMTMYGYPLLEKLPLLYFDLNGYEAFRFDFYNMVSKLFRESFLKQIYDWCTEHNCKLTGHMMCEDSIDSQLRCTGGVMPCYEYFHEPGIDWLGRQIASPVIPKQLSSVSAQLGRKNITETFALCGWDVSLNELKWIAEWQYVNGVTSLCPHLEGYSLKGLRKRDYPASLFTHLPWFDEAYKDFADYFTGLGSLLDSGKENPSLLVIHMMQSAYTVYNTNKPENSLALSDSFEKTAVDLSNMHIPHHYGDEIILEHHGSVKNGMLTVGKCSYSAVLLPELLNITENTARLLTEFAKSGGKIYVTGGMPRLCSGRKNSPLLNEISEAAVILDNIAQLRNAAGVNADISILTNEKENFNIHYTSRLMPDGSTLYYLVNLSESEQSICLKLPYSAVVKALDPSTGAEIPLSAEAYNGKTDVELKFAKYASFIITARSGHPSPEVMKSTEVLALNKRFKISSRTPNALTLDFCEARIDGGEWQKEKAVIQLQQQLLDLRRPCDVDMKFRFTVKEEFDFSDFCLCVETPQQFSFEINGKPFSFNDNGYYLDEAFRRSNIGEYVRIGENEIILHSKFYQCDNVYHVLYTPGIHEVEKNKLTLDTELESIYLTGSFSVEMDGEYRLGERRCMHGGHCFSLLPPDETVDISEITSQGFWFFAGKLSLSQSITIEKKSDTRYIIAFKALNAPAAKVFVNGEYAGLLAFAPFELDVTDLLKNGKNDIRILMLSGNRNLLGPHHKPLGESYSVGPSTFSDTHGWTDDPEKPAWTDNYSFVLFGAEL